MKKFKRFVVSWLPLLLVAVCGVLVFGHLAQVKSQDFFQITRRDINNWLDVGFHFASAIAAGGLSSYWWQRINRGSAGPIGAVVLLVSALIAFQDMTKMGFGFYTFVLPFLALFGVGVIYYYPRFAPKAIR
jgi:hypothetical protein